MMRSIWQLTWLYKITQFLCYFHSLPYDDFQIPRTPYVTPHNFQVFPGFSQLTTHSVSFCDRNSVSKWNACVCWGNNVIVDREKIAQNRNDLYRSKVRMEVIKVKISDPKTSTKRADVKNQYLLDLFGQRVTRNKEKKIINCFVLCAKLWRFWLYICAKR